MDRVPIDSALILTTTRLFNRPGMPSPARPLTVVGGLSLFQRTILTLQRGGITRFIVLAGDETEDLQRHLHADGRIRASVRWLPVLEFSPGDLRTWEIFPGLFGAPYLVVGTGAVFPASLVARVRQEAGNGALLVVMREDPSSASGIGRSTFFTEQFLSSEASPPPIPPPGAPIALPNAMGHGRVREGGQSV